MKSNKKFNKYLSIIITITLIFITGILFTLHNIELKKSLAETQSPSDLQGFDERIRITVQSNSGVNIVDNSKIGIWDKEGNKQIKVVHELTLGGNNNRDNVKVTFFRAYPVIADDKGNIYVAEAWSDGTIKKFNAYGNYLLTLGKKGQGPGEFAGFFTFFVDKDQILHILDQGSQRINKFTSDGKFLSSFSLREKYASTEFQGFVMDNAGHYYISFYDIENEQVIHQYSPDGKFLTSFGKPIFVKNAETYIGRAVKATNSRGSIFFYKGKIIYSQRNPYEIRIYNLNGMLEKIILRKNSFMPPDKVEILGEDGYGFTIPAHSVLIGIWRGMIINCVFIPHSISRKIGTVIDIFSLDGQLLTSVSLSKHIYFSCIDRQGKLYGNSISFEQEERIVRYALKL